MDTGRISEGAGGSPGLVSSVSDKGGNPVSSWSESYSVSTVPKPSLNGAGQADFPLVFPETYEPGDPPLRGSWKRRLEALRRGRSGNEKRLAPESVFSGAMTDRTRAVHDPPRQQREQPGDHKRPGKNENHDAAMIGDLVTVRLPHGERKHRQRKDRQQVNRAPRTDQPDLVDPERTDCHGRHQAHPDPADGAMRQRSLRCRELDRAKHECGHRRERMKGDCGSGIQ